MTTTIIITDPATDQTWRIPRKPTTTINADVSERWVANVIVPEEVCDHVVVPDFLEPVRSPTGFHVLSLCAIFMRHAAPTWAPITWGPASHNCALRVACRDVRDGTMAVWVDHRYSDTYLVRALPKLGFPPVLPLLNVARNDECEAMTLATGDGAITCSWHGCERPWQPAAFADAQDFEDYFCAGIRSYGPTMDAERFSVVDLDKRSDNHFAWQACDGDLRLPGGHWPLDGVYLTRDGRYQWRYCGDVDRDGRLLAATRDCEGVAAPEKSMGP